ncbi:MAG: YggS family pyridoxal phosphate-dependent enzyme, partial [Gammaproteobacteria bacterium]|nr:YggS family pyridoxal phosphate-dependent enzyme [Gammaproteobacteria bacterium]
MQNIEKNLNRIHGQIAEAATACGRDPDSILLLAVSKRKPASDIRLARQLGQRHFGENYLQEALE